MAAFLLLAPALAMGIWLSAGDHARDALGRRAETQRVLAEHDFATYYRSDAAAAFQTHVTTNNIQVSFLAFVVGHPRWASRPRSSCSTTAPTSASARRSCTRTAQGAQFWGLITPHGLLELTSICVAGGAGLCLAWAIIAPGDRTRAAALAGGPARRGPRRRRDAVFVVAGFIEAWVTPSSLPTWTRVGIGVVVEAIFLAVRVRVGSTRPRGRGLTGDCSARRRRTARSQPAGRLDAQVGVGELGREPARRARRPP